MPYLDYAASAPLLPAARDALLRDVPGNADSGHAPGRAAAARLNKAREAVSRALNAQPPEVILTSGGTESNNLAILGAARAKKRGHLITTSLDHPAVLEPVKALAVEGFTHTILPPDKDGRISPEAVRAALRSDTILVSCTLCCHETGAVNDLSAIAAVLRKLSPDTLLHTDAVQAFGRIPADVRAMGVDLLSLSGHKIGAPGGIGALYCKRNVSLAPLMYGGGQEGGLRPGTSPVGLAAALAAAVDAERGMRHTEIKDYVLDRLSSFADVRVIPPHDAPHIVCFAVPGIPAGVMVRFLSDQGVYVSAGAACGKGRRSPVLAAMGLPVKTVDSAIRVSFGHSSTQEDIDALVNGLAKALGELVRG
jgi:cysteine desulfurase